MGTDEYSAAHKAFPEDHNMYDLPKCAVVSNRSAVFPVLRELICRPVNEVCRLTHTQCNSSYRLDGQGSIPCRCKRLFSTESRLALGHSQLSIRRALGALSSGVQRPEHNADHSATANTKEPYLHPFISLHGGVVLT
jgi:hypothetical protein